MSILNKSKEMVENFAKSTYIKIGQTTQEVFDNVKKDALYSNKYLGSGETMHTWTLPKTGFASHYNDGQIVTVQIIIKDGVVVDGSHFKMKNKKEVEYIFIDGERYKQQHKDDNDEGINFSEFEIINRQKYDCNEQDYKEYLFDTIQYCDDNKPFAFISYSSKDYERVWTDVINLQIKGYNLWIDKNMKETEDSWKSSAKNALDNPNCKLVIFYLSNTSIISSPCLEELKHREKNNIPYIVTEAKNIGSFDSFISTIDTTNTILNEMFPHFIPSSRKRIKCLTEKEHAQSYYDKIENNLNENGVTKLANEKLYSKAIKALGEFNGQHSAIALLDYCYSQGYLPAMMLRTFIQEKPVFKDFFTNNKSVRLNKLQEISKKDEWLKTAENYKGKHYIEQSAAFYSAYALVNNDSKSYKEATKLWALTSQKNKILFNSCQQESTIYAYNGDWEMEANVWFTDFFDLSPLSYFPIQDFSVTNLTSNKTYNAWDILPNANNNGNKEPTIEVGASGNDTTLKQVMLNYMENYQSNSLWDTEAGYYAVQLAIWGRIKNYDPANLTIIQQEELATKIRSLASTLYNDRTEVTYSVGLQYNGSDISDSYNLSEGVDGKVSLFYDNGTWYYSSKKMKITSNGYPGDIEWTVTVNGDGYVADGAGDNSKKLKTLTVKASEDSAFYFYLPYGTTATESSIDVSIKYNYGDAVIWNFSSDAYGSGQRMISPHVVQAEKSYAVKFKRDAKADTQPEEETNYKAKINFTKTGVGVIDYSTSTVNGEILYSLTSGLTNIDTYLAFYTVEKDGTNKIMGKGAYKTSGGKLTANKLPLAYINNEGIGGVLVCEIDSPAGYGQFKDDKNPFEVNGKMYSCFKYGFNTANADTDNVITRDITEEDLAKTFSVSVTKKDQNGTLLSGYNFGLYTTKAITVSGKTTISAGSLVAYATTGSDGKATFSSYLPASQNYVLKEIGSGDNKTAITIDGNTTYGTEVTLDVLDKATVDGYSYDVEVTNQIVYTGGIKITKTDKKTGAKLAGATFNVVNDFNIYTCTTGEDGTCTIENVEYGIYKVQETGAPVGYVLNSEEQEITVNSALTSVTFKNNKQATGSFDVKKNISSIENTTDSFKISVEEIIYEAISKEEQNI